MNNDWKELQNFVDGLSAKIDKVIDEEDTTK